MRFAKSRSKTFWFAVALAALGILSQLDPSTAPNPSASLGARIWGAIVAAAVLFPLAYLARYTFRWLGRVLRRATPHDQRATPGPTLAPLPTPLPTLARMPPPYDNSAPPTSAPRATDHLSLNELHSSVADAASPAWQAGFYRLAVEEVAKAVNATLQHKTGRHDVSDVKLIEAVFSPNPGKPGDMRLRPPGHRGTPSWDSRLRGASLFAQGCYAAIRNPAAHQAMEWGRVEAFHYLVAFSIVATWIQEFELENYRG